jgi:NADH-quinone oxidoreductase subunit J
MTALDAVFGLLGLVAVGAAFLVVATRHMVHAALWLVVCLAAVAGCFLVLTAEFLAWVQLLIYVGAVVVLLLFGLMLTRAPIGPITDLSGPRRLLAAAVAFAVSAVLATVLIMAFGSATIDLTGAPQGDAAGTGATIFRSWVLPFEIISLLLLSALVGAIALSRASGERIDA